MTNTPPRRSNIAFGRISSALRVYRVMAFLTGTVLMIGVVGLLLEHVGGIESVEDPVGVLWLVHGYLFMVYALVALNIGVHMRWNSVKVVLLIAAGTVPTMSFVAERLVMKHVQKRADS